MNHSYPFLWGRKWIKNYGKKPKKILLLFFQTQKNAKKQKKKNENQYDFLSYEGTDLIDSGLIDSGLIGSGLAYTQAW